MEFADPLQVLNDANSSLASAFEHGIFKYTTHSAIIAFQLFGDTVSNDELSLYIELIDEIRISTQNFAYNFDYDKGDFFKTLVCFNNAVKDFKYPYQEQERELSEHKHAKLFESLKEYWLDLHFAQVAYRDKSYLTALALFASSENKLSKAYALFNLDYDAIVKKGISEKSTKAASAKWEQHNRERPQLKEKYLKIMRKKGFTSMSQASEYIFTHENPENKKYQWIYDRLREAVKGNFD